MNARTPSGGRTHHFWWVDAPGSGAGESATASRDSWCAVGDASFWEGRSRKPAWFTYRYPPPMWADDLYRLARAVFVADKHVQRAWSADGWTRSLRVSVPVSEPQRWRGAARGHLLLMLQTMTGDHWDLDFRPARPRFTNERLDIVDVPADVTLFSGGLDSLSWAADQAARDSDRPLLLVQFGEQQLEKRVQEVVAATLMSSRERFPRAPMVTVPLSQQVRLNKEWLGHQLPGNKDVRSESTTRTRGFLYMAAAIRAAAAEGNGVVHIPENGLVALNPPLTAARTAACSTRSVHPWTLYQLNAAVNALGGAVTAVNPFADRTKGEVCRFGLAAGLTGAELGATLSCGRTPVRRRGGSGHVNCGACFPCLIRRAALHAAGKDTSDYRYHPWRVVPENEASRKLVRDWRALLRWVGGRPFDLRELVGMAPLPPGAGHRELVSVVRRGRVEVRDWIAETAGAGRPGG